MKKIPSVSPANGLSEAAAFFPNGAVRKTPVALKAAKNGQQLGVSGSEEALLAQPSSDAQTPVDQAVVLGSETASSLPGLLDTAPENFSMLAQAPAATSVSASAGSNAAASGFLGGASATTIGAIAAGVVVVGAAAASGGGSSDTKSISTPTVATSTGGALAVTIGSDASTAKLYAGTTDITAKFTSAKVGSVVTFTPVAGQVEYTAQAITAKAVDAAGALSADSASVSYTFDNVAPSTAPSLVSGAAGAIAVTIGADATTAKLFAGTTDISAKFTSSKAGSVVTFTPVAGQVEYVATAVTAKASDAAGNLSGASSALTYSFDNVSPAAAPVLAAGTGGSIAVTIGADATTAALFAGTTDISAKFTSSKAGSVVTFTPVAGQVEYVATAVTAKASDAAGNLSGASSALTYSFDNVSPAAAPVLAAGTGGSIAVTIGADATTAALFAGTTDISAKFTSAKVGSVITFTPVAGQVEYVAQAVTAKAADAAGNQSPVSTAISYTFDSVAPAAAPTATANATSGAIAVTIGEDATTATLFAGTTDITSKFTSAKVGSVVTFTPVAGQVEYVAQAITAKAADIFGNLSPASGALTYSYDNVAPAAAPVLAAGAAGAISVTIGSDATTAKLFDGATDVGFAFTATKVGSVVTFTPNAASVEVVNLPVTAKAADAAGNLSAASSVLTYTFDNIAPAAAPTAVVNAATGAVAVTIGADATTASLYAGSTDISAKFTSAKVGSVVTFTPVAGQVEFSAQALTAKASDASGNLSPASTAANYSFDNVAPPAPTSVTGNSTNGVVTVNFGTSSGQVASTVKLFAGTTGVSAKYVADTTVAGVVTYTPIAGQVELSAQTLNATVADASGNVSASATAAAAYTFDNAIDITSANVSVAAYSAAGANYAYTVNEGTYALSIAGFSAGDQIAFKGTSTPAVSIVNTSGTDGAMAITASYGSNVVDVNLTGVAPVSDAQVLGLTSFNTVFGAGSLTGASTATTGQSTATTISSTNSATVFDASASNVAYTISEGTYAATITKFAAGDSINFSGVAAASLSVVNSSAADGSIVITGNFGSNVVDLTLTGLSAAQDSAILGQTSFNNLFGSAALGSTATGPSGSAVAVSASNASAGFTASSGNFAYAIAEGTYSTTITGFGPGDSLSFFGSNTASLSVTNTSGSDGVVSITGVFNGQAVDVTLSGLSTVLDSQVIGVNSFNNAFGASSIIA